MQRTTRTAQRGEIVQTGGDPGRAIVSGPATRWMAGDNIDFPIDRLAGGDVGQVGGAVAIADADRVLGTVGGVEEYATPVSRAKGQMLRTLPFAVVWLVLGVGVVWLLALEWPWLMLWWGVLTAVSFWRLNREEFLYSRNGVERHRIDASADIAEKQLDQQHELKRMALTTYLEIAKAQYLGLPNGGSDDSDS